MKKYISMFDIFIYLFVINFVYLSLIDFSLRILTIAL